MNQLLAHLHQHFAKKKILILGWGREGKSTYKALQTACPEARLAISDQNTALTTPKPFEPYLENLTQYDVIFKTAGIPIHLPELQEYLHHGGRITSQLNEFLAVYRSRTIGVTGTKGKSTTSSLIEHFLKALGQQTLLAGNIGTPVFDVADQITPEHQIVIEMSSYQLESITTSPHVAVLLNLFSEHINYHGSFQNYTAAKANITKFQKRNDLFIYNADSPEVAQIAARSDAQKLAFSYDHSRLYTPRIDPILKTLSDTQLPEIIKSKNALPALLAVSDHIRSDQDVSAIQQSLTTFQPLSHRLEVVSQAGNITWIDDTLATIPEATIAALDAVPNVDVLLLGGYDRGISYTSIVEAVMKKKIPVILFFPPSGKTMHDMLCKSYPKSLWPMMYIVNDMEEAIHLAYEHAPEHGTVLLSPSSPSFGQFKDYEDKSAQFKKWIQELLRHKS